MRRSDRRPPSLTAAALTAVLLGLLPGPAHAAPTVGADDFYVDPGSSVRQWVDANRGDGRAPAIQASIANVPMARWFGNWSGAVGTATAAYTRAAAAAGKRPVLVAYNIPDRDICGGQSGGGAGSAAEYRNWIAAFAAGIGNRSAVVVLEPDSLGDESCMTPAQIAARNTLLNDSVAQFRAKAPNAWVYLDAGNPGWLSADTMARHLAAAGVAAAHGFSLNVSNYFTTAENIAYGNAVNTVLRATKGFGKPYVVDTSRNGDGSNGAWCNPAGRRIGQRPQTGGGAEMLLWIKVPGESDGNCGVGAGSTGGQFLPEVAYRMVHGY